MASASRGADRSRLEVRASLLADAGGAGPRFPAAASRTGCRTLALYVYWRGGAPSRRAADRGRGGRVVLGRARCRTAATTRSPSWRHADTPRRRCRGGLAERTSGRPAADVRPDGGLRDVQPARCRAGLRRHRLSGRRVRRGAHHPGRRRGDRARPALVERRAESDPVCARGGDRAEHDAAPSRLGRPRAQYYRESLRAASARHRSWAAAHYATVAHFRDEPFWRDRAVGASAFPHRPCPILAAGPVALSPQLALDEVPCIDGEFVALTPALRHPALEEPLAYLGGWPVAPLMSLVRPGMTLPTSPARGPTRCPLARVWRSPRGCRIAASRRRAPA